MIITVQIAAPVNQAQAVKEILAHRIEGIGQVKILEIRDDGYGRQEEIHGQ